MAAGHAFFLLKQKSLFHINKLQLLILLLLSLFVHGTANKFQHKNRVIKLDYSTKQNVYNLIDPSDPSGPTHTQLFLEHGSGYQIQIQSTHIAPNQYGPIQTQTYDPIGLSYVQLTPGQIKSTQTQTFIPYGTSHIQLILGQFYPTQTQTLFIPSGPSHILLIPGQLYPIQTQTYILSGPSYVQLTLGQTNSIQTQTFIPSGSSHILLIPGQINPTQTQVFIPFVPSNIQLIHGQMYPIQTQIFIPSGTSYIQSLLGTLDPIQTQTYDEFRLFESKSTVCTIDLNSYCFVSMSYYYLFSSFVSVSKLIYQSLIYLFFCIVLFILFQCFYCIIIGKKSIGLYLLIYHGAKAQDLLYFALVIIFSKYQIFIKNVHLFILYHPCYIIARAPTPITALHFNRKFIIFY